MKRWQWVSLVALAGLAAVAVAVLPFRGAGNTGDSLAANGQGPKLEVDMIPDAGGTWCNPVDSTSTAHVFGQPSGTYQVAICATDVPVAIGGFEFQLRYNTGLNQCVPQTGGSFFDQNPDANLGATKFNGTLPAPNGLGTGWNCNVSDVAPPTCANLSNRAFLQCTTVIGTLELPFGEGVSEPIAVINFSVLAGGPDTLQLTNVSVIDANTDEIFACSDQDRAHCSDGTDTKEGPLQATPTLTPIPSTPTPTPAYCGNRGQPTCTPTPRPFTSTPSPGPTATATAPSEQPPPPPPPPSGGQAPAVIPPSTGEGSGMPWGLPIAAIIVGLTAASLISGGICVRFARRR